MSNQSTYVKDRQAFLAAQKAADNARAAKKKVDDAKKNIKLYGDKIREIQTINIKPAQLEIKNLEVIIAIRKRNWNDEYRRRQPLDSSDLIALENDPDYGDKTTRVYLGQIDGYKTRIKTANADIANYKKKIKEQQTVVEGKKPVPPKKTKKTDGNNTSGSGDAVVFTQDYKYNAPMVKSAYFTSNKGVSGSLVGVTNDGNFVDQGNYQDALNAWKGTTGGRGTIQMDRKWVNSMSTSLSANANTLDPQMYGFKFLYNPKEVAMAWGIQQSMDPSFLANGSDAFQVVSAGLLSSTIQVTLLINRIDDFTYINANGFNKGFGSLSASAAALRDQTATQKTNPYPLFVSNDEAKEIYNKGTMYDIEYLFKTINGPHATFISKLNGKTADRGWMRPSVVELHLGASMRYRVRISQFAVTHSVFNSRMVPILSSVQLTMARFNDGPTPADKQTQNGSWNGFAGQNASANATGGIG